MRVAIADDSVLFRSGLRHLLEEIGVDVIAECGSGEALLQQLDALAGVDAVVLDIRMPPTFTNEGIATAAQIRRRHPEVGILVLSTYAESGYASELLATGSSHLGYLLKDRVDDAGMVRDALVRLAGGGSVLDPGVVARLVARKNHIRTLDRLTDRERAVLGAMAEGKSNIGISQQLYLSPKTVEAHIASIFTKLDMPIEGDTNRRVRAALHWLNANANAR